MHGRDFQKLLAWFVELLLRLRVFRFREVEVSMDEHHEHSRLFWWKEYKRVEKQMWLKCGLGIAA